MVSIVNCGNDYVEAREWVDMESIVLIWQRVFSNKDNT